MVVWDTTTVVAEPVELLRLTCEQILCDRYSNVQCCITTAVTGSKTKSEGDDLSLKDIVSVNWNGEILRIATTSDS